MPVAGRMMLTRFGAALILASRRNVMFRVHSHSTVQNLRTTISPLSLVRFLFSLLHYNSLT
jgi:hypothetical protein